MRRLATPTATLIAAASLVGAATAPAAEAATPKVRQLVVFPGGKFDQGDAVKAAATTAKVGGKRCALGAGTPLAALVARERATVSLRDYGGCSRRAADAGALYVRSIRGHRAKGPNGWVYKVDNKVAPAGAGDPSGPFGRGRLKNGQRVTWFYCRKNMRTGSCQRTLGITKLEALGGGQVQVTVRSYNDNGRSRPAGNVLVESGDATARTDEDGVATLTLQPGRAIVHAESKGLVRSFEEPVEVR
jgi:hypothetical protein